MSLIPRVICLLRQRGSGKTPGALDLLIAAHGISAEAVIVTSDQAFSFVEGISLEDWAV
jgi:predicted nucleic acid-binding protein